MVAAVLRKPQRISPGVWVHCRPMGLAAPSSASRAVALSFSGGGLIAAAYHLGVYQGLRGAELLDARTAPLVGASAGALVAAVLSAEVHLDDATGALSRIVDSVVAAGAGPLGRPKVDILRLARALTRCGPSWSICCQRTHTSAATAEPSSSSPIFRAGPGLAPSAHRGALWGVRAAAAKAQPLRRLVGGALIDGGFKTNFPLHPTADRTVRVSPFSGELDICPEVRGRPPRRVLLPSKVRIDVTRANASAVRATLWPPRDGGWLQDVLAQGFDDACRWLRREQQQPRV
ncbi:hypothetical protein EMIHUDRAFT_465293 [Emiliania huxleyi CCMP1516]|uniref:PNPLA domain-containing protein n=2 Tax=Emiliania huxleyi TaxID=2903 RepID=A0A0D3IG93_EMIH1|nr:hypothetical protein EMIHUDRAFT_465293 [Emiliania huxleyi CCMP1516]EOD10278.1 hypothetical protein EMIHUDRAFT_465293 [Emiliania huxleyi CCMP1516]|eukprot:XP_005762707.1 hypothetical protein EMIHUDRAFT_465293 [Emiliania huxleyi CCMP1516]